MPATDNSANQAASQSAGQPAARGVALVTGGAGRRGRAPARGLGGPGGGGGGGRPRARRAAGRRAPRAAAPPRPGRGPDCSAALGVPSCLVNNASLFQYDVATSFSYASLDTHMRTNVAAPLLLARELHKALAAAAGPDGAGKAAEKSAEKAAEPRGVVINLLDQKLDNLNPDFLSYTLSKAALQTATVQLAQALAPRLRVVGVAPGITLVSGEQSEQSFRRAHRVTPLGQSSTPEDIAQAVAYLAQARAVTGTTLYVDGGQHLMPLARDVMFLTE